MSRTAASPAANRLTVMDNAPFGHTAAVCRAVFAALSLPRRQGLIGDTTFASVEIAYTRASSGEDTRRLSRAATGGQLTRTELAVSRSGTPSNALEWGGSHAHDRTLDEGRRVRMVARWVSGTLGPQCRSTCRGVALLVWADSIARAAIRVSLRRDRGRTADVAVPALCQSDEARHPSIKRRRVARVRVRRRSGAVAHRDPRRSAGPAAGSPRSPSRRSGCGRS